MTFRWQPWITSPRICLAVSEKELIGGRRVIQWNLTQRTRGTMMNHFFKKFTTNNKNVIWFTRYTSFNKKDISWQNRYITANLSIQTNPRLEPLHVRTILITQLSLRQFGMPRGSGGSLRWPQSSAAAMCGSRNEINLRFVWCLVIQRKCD